MKSIGINYSFFTNGAFTRFASSELFFPNFLSELWREGFSSFSFRGFPNPRSKIKFRHFRSGHLNFW